MIESLRAVGPTGMHSNRSVGNLQGRDAAGPSDPFGPERPLPTDRDTYFGTMFSGI